MATTIETGSTASQAYTKGSYFFYNNRLVKASSAIASGATLTIGSNIAYVNAADELSAHLRANDSSRSEFYFDVKDGKYGYYPSAAKTSSTFVPFGGTLSETTLYTNPNPSSAFAEQTLTIGNFSSYDYLRIYYRVSTSNASVISSLISVADLKTTVDGNNTPRFVIGTRITYNCARMINYVSDTQLMITAAAKFNASGTSTSNVIPTKITGIK